MISYFFVWKWHTETILFQKDTFKANHRNLTKWHILNRIFWQAGRASCIRKNTKIILPRLKRDVCCCCCSSWKSSQFAMAWMEGGGSGGGLSPSGRSKKGRVLRNSATATGRSHKSTGSTFVSKKSYYTRLPMCMKMLSNIFRCYAFVLMFWESSNHY